MDVLTLNHISLLSCPISFGGGGKSTSAPLPSGGGGEAGEGATLGIYYWHYNISSGFSLHWDKTTRNSFSASYWNFVEIFVLSECFSTQKTLNVDKAVFEELKACFSLARQVQMQQ